VRGQGPGKDIGTEGDVVQRRTLEIWLSLLELSESPVLEGETWGSLEPEVQPLSRRRMKFLKTALKSMLASVSIANEEQSPF